MNDFVNPQHRGVNLPAGYKDLMDVLEAKGTPGTETPIYALHSNRASPVFEWHVNGLNQVERFLNQLLNSKSKDSFLSCLLKSGRFFALKRSGEILKVFVTFGEGDLILGKNVERNLCRDWGCSHCADSFACKRNELVRFPRSD